MQIVEKNKELQIELGKALSASQGSSSSPSENAMSIANILELHKCVTENAEKKRDEMIEENKKLIVMKEKAEREINNLKEEKKKLEYDVGDLFNATDLNKQKLKKIKQILDE
jgi:predicted nuclease with TOPRIM domain